MNLEDTIIKHSQLPRRFFVEFALSCDNDTRGVLHPLAIRALDITQMWLEGKATDDEVRNAYDNTSYSPTLSIYCIILPHYARRCYACVLKAINILNPSNPKVKEQEYAQRFLDKVNNLTKVEKVLYGII